MREINLREHAPTDGIRLSVEERDALSGLGADLTITPAHGEEDVYNIKASSRVGAMRVGDMAVRIRPKLDISRVMFLLSYVFDPKHWRDERFQYEVDDDLLEMVVPTFLGALSHAFKRGILQGYRVREEALSTVRGRIRFEDQIRFHQGAALPVEVRYDEFTEDIEENRILKAAIERLRHLPLRSPRSKTMLARNAQLLEQVSLVEYDPKRMPEFNWTRLDDRYEPAVHLAELILHSRSWELHHGRLDASAFLVDMNELFENFVIAALREKLRLGPDRFPQGGKGKPRLYLAHDQKIRLKPGLSWWEGGSPVFVGDAKYKRIKVDGMPNADLYQLLAYCIAMELPGGLLIYAKDEGSEGTRRRIVRHLGHELQIVALDLERSPDQILAQFDAIAADVRRLRARALSERTSAA